MDFLFADSPDSVTLGEIIVVSEAINRGVWCWMPPNQAQMRQSLGIFNLFSEAASCGREGLGGGGFVNYRRIVVTLTQLFISLRKLAPISPLHSAPAPDNVVPEHFRLYILCDHYLCVYFQGVILSAF